MSFAQILARVVVNPTFHYDYTCVLPFCVLNFESLHEDVIRQNAFIYLSVGLFVYLFIY